MIFNSACRDLVLQIIMNKKKIFFNYNLIGGAMFIVILH